MTDASAPQGENVAKVLRDGRNTLRLNAIKHLREEGKEAFRRAEIVRHDPVHYLESEFVKGDGDVIVATLAHYELTTGSAPTVTPLWRQVMLSHPKRVKIIIFVREDGEIVYHTPQAWYQKKVAPTKLYPLELVEAAHVMHIEQRAFA